jgi:hypothetical protein
MIGLTNQKSVKTTHQSLRFIVHSTFKRKKNGRTKETGKILGLRDKIENKNPSIDIYEQTKLRNLWIKPEFSNQNKEA